MTKAKPTKAEPAKAEETAPETEGNDIPKSSLTSAITTDLPNDAPPAPKDEPNPDPAVEAGLGLVKVMGIDFRYVGVAPARDKDAKTPAGLPITVENSTFTPLGNVPFSNSIQVKDPKSGEFYYPDDTCRSWEACEHNGNKLIPAKAKTAK